MNLTNYFLKTHHTFGPVNIKFDNFIMICFMQTRNIALSIVPQNGIIIAMFFYSPTLCNRLKIFKEYEELHRFELSQLIPWNEVRPVE